MISEMVKGERRLDGPSGSAAAVMLLEDCAHMARLGARKNQIPRAVQQNHRVKNAASLIIRCSFYKPCTIAANDNSWFPAHRSSGFHKGSMNMPKKWFLGFRVRLGMAWVYTNAGGAQS